MKTTTEHIQDMYDRLLDLNKEAFDVELFDVAYHALRAALHCAEELPSDEPLHHIGSLAVKQIASIDKLHPEYAHSTHSAKSMGQSVSVFAAITNEAEARLMIRETERKRKKRLQYP